MRLLKVMISTMVAMLLLSMVAFAAPGGSMTRPADYDQMADGYFNIRHIIGYGDIENDPMAHGLTVYDASNVSSTTPELGDSVVSTAAVAGLCAAALVGVGVADKKRRELAK